MLDIVYFLLIDIRPSSGRCNSQTVLKVNIGDSGFYLRLFIFHSRK